MRAVVYILNHTWPRVLFILFTGYMLFTVLDSMESARWLAKGSIQDVVLLYMLRAPGVMMDLVGPAVVLGILSGVGALNRRAEMAALAASGRSIKSTALPAVMLVASFMAAGHAASSQWLLPETSQMALGLSVETFGIYGPRFWSFFMRSEWFKAGPLYGKAQPGPNGTYANVMAVVLDEQGAIQQRIQAKGMAPSGETAFHLEDAAVTTLAPVRSYERIKKRDMELPAAAAALASPIGFPEHFDWDGLRETVRIREMGGRDSSSYRVALMRRVVDPLMILLLAALALPLAVRQRREAPVEKLLFVGGLAVAVAQVLGMVGDELASKAVLPLWVGGAVAPLVVAFAAWRAWRGVEDARKAR